MSTKKLRVTHIIPYYDPAWAYGGPVRVAVEIGTRTAEHGHAVTVLTTDAKDQHTRAQAGRHDVQGVTVRRYRNLSNGLAWRRLFMPLGFGRGLQRYLQNTDVVHVHDYRSVQNAFALVALKRTGTPYIVTPHGGLPADLRRSGIKQIYDRLVGDEFLARSARLHALTDMEQAQYTAMGHTEDRIEIIPNGIDVTAFDLEADVAGFKNQYDIPSGSPVVGFLGRLSEIKGLDFLVEAFAALLSDLPEAILVLAGPDDGALPGLKAQIAQAGINQRVRFTGYMSDPAMKAAAYRAFDVYVLPSRYEMSPIAILEAMLNETAGILTDRCGLAGLLAGEELAHVVSFGDVSGLRQTLFEQLTHPQIDVRRSRQYVIDHFNWDVLTERWIALYRDCTIEASENR